MNKNDIRFLTCNNLYIISFDKTKFVSQTGTLYFGAASYLTNVELANILIKLDKGALVCIYGVCSVASIMEEIFVCVRPDSEPE